MQLPSQHRSHLFLMSENLNNLIRYNLGGKTTWIVYTSMHLLLWAFVSSVMLLISKRSLIIIFAIKLPRIHSQLYTNTPSTSLIPRTHNRMPTLSSLLKYRALTIVCQHSLQITNTAHSQSYANTAFTSLIPRTHNRMPTLPSLH